jgi:hypothetical protein
VSYFVEFVRYRSDLTAADLVELRAAALSAVRAAHPELIDAPVLSQNEFGTWTDVWIYRTRAAADAANADAANIPEFAAFADALSGIEITTGRMPESAAPPFSG